MICTQSLSDKRCTVLGKLSTLQVLSKRFDFLPRCSHRLNDSQTVTHFIVKCVYCFLLINITSLSSTKPQKYILSIYKIDNEPSQLFVPIHDILYLFNWQIQNCNALLLTCSSQDFQYNRNILSSA